MERERLTASIVSRGVVEPEVVVPVTGPVPDGDSHAFVTGLMVGPGDVISSVSPVAEVSGRPVFVMEGLQPAYRALRPGMSGVDVDQLHAGLNSTGCNPGSSGVYNEATKVCLVQLYRDADYAPLPSSSSERDDLEAAESEISEAAEALTDAEATLAEALDGVTPLELLDARQAVVAAEGGVASAITEFASAKALAVTQLDAALRSLNRELVAANPDPTELLLDDADGAEGGGGGGAGVPAQGAAAIEIALMLGGIADLDGNGVSAGDTVSVAVSVLNVGEAEVGPPAVSLDRVGTVACGAGPLAIGEQRVCTHAELPLQTSDLGTAMLVAASATAAATDGSALEASATAELAVPGVPSVRLDKTIVEFVDVDGGGVSAGDIVRYSFVVTNTGNVPMTIVVDDPMLDGTQHMVTDGSTTTLDGTVPCGDPVVPVVAGAVRACDVVEYRVEAGQLGSVIENTAAVTATPLMGAAIIDEDSAAIYVPPACTSTGGATTTTPPQTTPAQATTTDPGTTTIPATTTTNPATTTSEPATTTTAPPASSTSVLTSTSDPGVASPSGYRQAAARASRSALPLSAPPCPPRGPETTTTTTTSTSIAPRNAAVPPTVELPDPTPDVAVGEAGGGGVMIIDPGSGSSSEDASILIGRRVVAAQALQTAIDDLGSAEITGEAGVAEAEAAVISARRQLTQLEGVPDTQNEERVVEQARAKLERLTSALETLQAASGATVPLGELVFVPSFPVRVDELNGVVGTAVGGGPHGPTPGVEEAVQTGATEPASLMALAPDGLVVRVQVPVSDLAMVQRTGRAQLLDEATGSVVDAIVQESGSPEANSRGIAMVEINLVGEQSLPVAWSGREVRVTFTADVTSNDVLVVPLSAVTLDDDGSARVTVTEADGTTRAVEVTAGVSANGWVEVEPTARGELSEGDNVLMGIDAPTNTASPPATGGSTP